MSLRRKAFLTLILAPPLLTELATGNTPAHAFLNPRVAIFLILAYSFPLLIIRELSLRFQLSAAGVFLLGLAYGIVNEGLLAQTLLRSGHVPIDKFDHYIYVHGLNFSWALVIVPWHAFFAVLFPLSLVAWYFPSCAQESWLSRRIFRLLTAVLVAAIAFISAVRPPHPQMTVCFLAIAVLSAAAFFFRGSQAAPAAPGSSRAAPFFFGFLSFPLFFLGSIILAAKRAPVPLFFFSLIFLLFIMGKTAQRRGFLYMPASAYLALGAYLSLSVFHLLAAIASHSAEGTIVGVLLSAAFLLLACRRRRRPAALP